MNENINILFAAGGTGGHLFPAIAVAEQLEKLSGNSNCNFHFLGTEGKIETRIVPQMGYHLHKLNLHGITKSLKTFAVPFQVLGAVAKCRHIIKEHGIRAVVAAGAYLSYPPGIAAAMEKIPLILMESNVNPGKSIRMLSNRASLIVTAFEESKSYYNPRNHSKIRYLGNPVRGDILSITDKSAARKKLNISIDEKVLFVFGGSLGARSINNAIKNNIGELAQKNIKVIWQTGKNFNIDFSLPNNIVAMEFVDDMATYYAAADLVIARSGATTVAELSIAAKPSILVPLPSASNNEQAANAKILQNNNACITVLDSDIACELLGLIDSLLADNDKLIEMGNAAKSLAKPNAASEVAKEILNLIN